MRHVMIIKGHQRRRTLEGHEQAGNRAMYENQSSANRLPQQQQHQVLPYLLKPANTLAAVANARTAELADRYLGRNAAA